MGTTIEVISLGKDTNFGKNQISNMLLLYHSVFLPELVYTVKHGQILPAKTIHTEKMHRKTSYGM